MKEAAWNKRELQRNMYELRDASKAQRLMLAGMAGVCVAIAWWLLLGGGLAVAGGWFGVVWKIGNPVRRLCLFAGFGIYYVRILFTEFVFLKRGVRLGRGIYDSSVALLHRGAAGD